MKKQQYIENSKALVNHTTEDFDYADPGKTYEQFLDKNFTTLKLGEYIEKV